MNTTRFFLFLSFLLMGNLVCSQPKPVKPISTNDAEAEKYLKALKLKLEKLQAYRIHYKIQTTDANAKTTDMGGSYTASGDKYCIEIGSTKSLSDGITQWMLDSKEKEIQISKIKKSKNTKFETPLDIVKKYNTLFKYRVKEPIQNGIIVLELIPLEKNSSYFKIDISIQTASIQMVSAKLYDKGGQRIMFKISKTEENVKLPIDFFKVDSKKYSDYEILDTR